MIGVDPTEIGTVGVIGTGTIGASWAALFLAQGKDVVAWDPAETAEPRLRAFVDNAWPTLDALGLKPGADRARLRYLPSAADVAAASDFIQESAPERIDVKRELYGEIEPAARPEVVISTSSSGLLMSELQAGPVHPERFVLGHPFNPPHLIPLVEVLGGAATDPAVVDWTLRFYEAHGKKAIRLNKEVPGHVANRMQTAMWREAIHLAVEGVASVADIDAAIAHGPGLRWALMGPHKTFHLAGGEGGMAYFLEHFREANETWWASLGQPHLTPEIRKVIVDGVADEVAGQTIPELAAERDRLLLLLVKTLKEARND